MGKKIIRIWIVVWSMFLGMGHAQSLLTLEDCIKIALENNLDYKVATLDTETSRINYKQSRQELLPSVNLDYNLGQSSGRSLDPFTNDFINQELTFSNAGLQLNATIFNGFRLMNKIKQNRFRLYAAQMQKEEEKQNLILEVTLTYIQLLNSRDALVLAKNRYSTTEEQLKRIEANYNEGYGNPADYTDIKGQLAMDKVGIINVKNELNFVNQRLIKLLNTDLQKERVINSFSDLDAIEAYGHSIDNVYNDALNNLATFKVKQYQIEATKSSIKVARSYYLPNIGLFGKLSTNYSSIAETFQDTGTLTKETGDFVNINNQDIPVLRNETQFQSNKIGYADQFNNNLNSVVGLSINIPIFNGFSAKNRVSLQKIELEQAVVDLENTKRLLKQAIANTYNNMESAYERFKAFKSQVNAFQESYRINKVKFENGVSNIVEYIVSKNNMDTAQLNLNKAKYEYLLQVKVLEYYRGL
ncbi:TolC family protein [Aestuariivivens insulae]|uniref:TolC family protein n=1 Tax=Aestuariivivens insulae TaxID=1621988 RepID=UPI001F55B025|nr:TolC family protein [Aestuariivivens insulae]